jgi:hypothetical protein
MMRVWYEPWSVLYTLLGSESSWGISFQKVTQQEGYKSLVYVKLPRMGPPWKDYMKSWSML